MACGSANEPLDHVRTRDFAVTKGSLIVLKVKAPVWTGGRSRILQTLRAIRFLTYVDLVERQVAGEAQVGDLNSLEKIVENVCYFPPSVDVFGAHDQFIIQTVAPLELPSRR